MAAFDIITPPLPAPAHSLQWRQLADSQLALALVNAARHTAATRRAPVLVITNTSEEAEQLRRELQFFAGEDPALPIYTFPDWETLPYDSFSPHQDIVSDRLSALYHLPRMHGGILLVPA